jgi:hypothetical protein
MGPPPRIYCHVSDGQVTWNVRPDKVLPATSCLAPSGRPGALRATACATSRRFVERHRRWRFRGDGRVRDVVETVTAFGDHAGLA